VAVSGHDSTEVAQERTRDDHIETRASRARGESAPSPEARLTPASQR
jgi:hypothetical protein